jgi:hypothetical protein
MERRLNYVAIVVAGIVYWLIQAGWYTVLGQQWLAAVGKTAAELQAKGNSPVPYVGSLICDVVVAWVLAWIIGRAGRTSAGGGAATGAVLSIGLVATALITQYLFEQRPMALFYINAGGALMGMTVMGAIVGAWRKKGTPKTVSAAA